MILQYQSIMPCQGRKGESFLLRGVMRADNQLITPPLYSVNDITFLC